MIEYVSVLAANDEQNTLQEVLLCDCWHELLLLSVYQAGCTKLLSSVDADADYLIVSDAEAAKCKMLNLQSLMSHFDTLNVSGAEYACLKALLLFRPRERVVCRVLLPRSAYFRLSPSIDKCLLTATVAQAVSLTLSQERRKRLGNIWQW